MQTSFRAIAERIERAHADFVETLEDLGDIDTPAAHKVKNLYLRHKLASVDTGIGRISVRHGRFLDREVIRRAVSM